MRGRIYRERHRAEREYAYDADGQAAYPRSPHLVSPCVSRRTAIQRHESEVGMIGARDTAPSGLRTIDRGWGPRAASARAREPFGVRRDA